jgi:histidine triad (HIT) family protein
VSTREIDPECLFCRLVEGKIPSQRLYEDDEILAFRDIHPKAPFHALVIPKTHIESVNALEDTQAALAGRLFLVAKQLAAEHGYPGYRCVVNTNREGGQIVFHLHLHVLAGRQMEPALG